MIAHAKTYMKSLQSICNTVAKMPLGQKLFWTIILVFSAMYTLIAIGDHYYYKTFCWDYGLFNHTYWKYAHFQIDNNFFDPPLTNSLQDHFSFTMMLLVPFYWLFGSWLTKSYTLLVIQVIFVVLGAVGTYKWVKVKTRHEWLSLAAMLHFFTIQGIVIAFTNDYRDILVASCMIPFFFYFHETKRLWWMLACLLFIISSKENMPVIFAFISVVLLVSDWKDTEKRKQCIIAAATCIAYTVLMFGWLIPLVSDPSRKSWVFKYYSLGNSFGEAAISLLKHPMQAIELLYINQSTNQEISVLKPELYQAMFLFWGCAFLVFKPKYLLMLVPFVLQKVYSDYAVMWGVYAYYSVELCCLLAGAVYISVAALRNDRLLKFLAVAIVSVNIYFTCHFFTGGAKVGWMANINKIWFFDSSFYDDGGQRGRFAEFSTHIPEQASLCCTQSLMTRFAFRDKISEFPHVRDYEYLVMDTTDSWPHDVKWLNDEKRKLILSGEWDTIFSKGKILVFRRRPTPVSGGGVK